MEMPGDIMSKEADFHHQLLAQAPDSGHACYESVETSGWQSTGPLSLTVQLFALRVEGEGTRATANWDSFQEAEEAPADESHFMDWSNTKSCR